MKYFRINKPLLLIPGFLIFSLFLFSAPGCPRESDKTGEDTDIKRINDDGPEDISAKVSAPPPEKAGTIEAVAVKPVSPARIAGVKARLDRHLRRWALKSPENTWALIHALLVFPPDTRLPDHGDLTILEAILSRAVTIEVEGRIVPTFMGEAPDGTPREPHANQVIMILLGAGIDPDHAFSIDGRDFTLNDLIESALWRFKEPHREQWEHESWTLTALLRARRFESNSKFTNHQGRTFEIGELVKRSATHLNREMEFIEKARDTGRPLEKKREGVHAHPCGGLHLASTPALWMEDPDLKTALFPAMERAASTLQWRLLAEHLVYDNLREEFPSHNIMISGQEMKFYGHWLETMSDFRDAGVDVDREKIDEAVSLLVKAVERLDRIGTFDRMEDVRIRRVQTYRDLIGDSAHALRGLRIWTE